MLGWGGEVHTVLADGIQEIAIETACKSYSWDPIKDWSQTSVDRRSFSQNRKLKLDLYLLDDETVAMVANVQKCYRISLR